MSILRWLTFEHTKQHCLFSRSKYKKMTKKGAWVEGAIINAVLMTPVRIRNEQ